MKNSLRTLIYLFISGFFFSCGEKKDVSEIKLIPVKIGNDIQFIDQIGKIIINPQFQQASIFRNGLALVQIKSEKPLWGFISEDGRYKIVPKYKSATVFSEDLAWVVAENSAPTVITSKGVIKFTMQDADSVKLFKEGLAAYCIIDTSGVKWGFVNNVGKVIISPQFNQTRSFSSGKCAVKNSEGKWGYINNLGQIMINYQFDKARDFVNNKAIVFSGIQAGSIDEFGKYVINPQYTNMVIDEDYYIINQDGKFGWIDMDGKILINPQFADAFPFGNNELAPVKSGVNYGFINKEGTIVINPQFDFAFPFNGKKALVVSGKKAGFIDKDGKYVINPQFDDIPMDLAFYLISGGSKFESVETDFFNISAIVDRINFINPEGLSENSNMSEVLLKFNKTEYDFDQYSLDHLIFLDKKITNDISISFIIRAKILVDVPDGWYTKKVFNKFATLDGFRYVISLTGKASGKANEIIQEIEKLLIGYKKDLTSSPDQNMYTNNKKIIRLYIYESKIVFDAVNIEDEIITY